jgi:hypothetical protein
VPPDQPWSPFVQQRFDPWPNHTEYRLPADGELLPPRLGLAKILPDRSPVQPQIPGNLANALPFYEMLMSNYMYLFHPEHAPFLPDASWRRGKSCLRVVHYLNADWCTF